MQRLTDLTNEFMEKFLNAIDPRDYEMDREHFVKQALTAPAIISAGIIDKVSGTFHIERRFILKQYIEKLNLAIRWVDHKNKV